MHADSLARLILSVLLFLFTTILNAILKTVRANGQPLELPSILNNPAPPQPGNTSPALQEHTR